MREETFTVNEIHCQSCEWTIKTILGEVEGVESVDPRQETNRVTVSYDEAKVGQSAIANTLANAGFPVI